MTRLLALLALCVTLAGCASQVTPPLLTATTPAATEPVDEPPTPPSWEIGGGR